MRIGVICPAEIAERRFIPSMFRCEGVSLAGVGVYSKEERSEVENTSPEVFRKKQNSALIRAKSIVDRHGGKVYKSYMDVVTSAEVDAVYIPLPPALHYKWAKIAVNHGKHVLVEKPCTTNLVDCKDLVEVAKRKGVAIHENYMFLFHKQIDDIKRIIREGEIGDVRLYRISFGFPRRSKNDFRYSKALGGGALLDAGGYTICYARNLLGDCAKIKHAQSNYINGVDVDMYGTATLVNENGETAQIAFGMDNSYKCELEVWGSSGVLSSGRVLTAPDGYTPTATIRKGNEDITYDLSADDAFLKSIQYFIKCIEYEDVRAERYKTIMQQAEDIEEFKRAAGWLETDSSCVKQ